MQIAQKTNHRALPATTTLKLDNSKKPFRNQVAHISSRMHHTDKDRGDFTF